MSKLACPIFLISVLAAFGQDTSAPGETVYNQHCAPCHNSGAVRIPSRSVLQQRTSAAIAKVLESGVMKQQGSALSSAERLNVAQWLGRKTAVAIDPSRLTNSCNQRAMRDLSNQLPSWTSWGGGLANLRFQTLEAAGLTAAEAHHLKLK